MSKELTSTRPAAQSANENPLSDKYINKLIQQHGYQSPEAVIARLNQWIGLHGGEDEVTLLMHGAHRELSKLSAHGVQVAEVVNKFGDPVTFAERELRVLVDIQQLPIGTKLYANTAPPTSKGTVGV